MNRKGTIVIIGIGVLFIAVIQWLGFNGLYGQDSYEYARYAEAWANYFSTGTHPGDYAWPVNYPFTGGLIAFLTGIKAATALQWLSMASFIAIALLLLRLMRLLYPQRKAYAIYWVPLALLLAPYVTRSALVTMSEQYAALWCLATFYAAIMIRRQKHWWWIGLFFCAAMAIMTRYVCALVVLPIGLFALPQLKHQKGWIPFVLGGVLALAPLYPHYWLRSEQLLAFTDHAALTEWRISHWFSRTFSSELGQFSFPLPNILYVFYPFFHPGFWFFGVLLLPFIQHWKRSKEGMLLAACIGIFLLFTAGMDTQNSRYFMVIIPFIVLLMYPLFGGLMIRIKTWKPVLAMPFYGALLAGQLVLCGYAFSKTYAAHQREVIVAKAFETVQGKTVYTYGIDQSLRHYNKNNQFISLHLQDGLNPTAGTYFLFDHGWRTNAQVKELFQVRLWHRLSKEHRLKSLQKIGDSWELYEVLP